MANVSSTKVLAAISSTPLSATGIAKKLGLSKGSQIQSILDELVGDGSVVVDDSGRFPVYTKSTKKASKKTAVTKTEQSNVPAETPTGTDKGGEMMLIPPAGEPVGVTAPADKSSYVDLNGYTITKPAKNKSGQVGTRVTLPITDSATGKNKTIFVREGMTLVVINDKPCYMVDTPARLILACHTYAKENNLTTYAIQQAHVGVINGEGDIKMSDVVVMKIKKIDKGA